MTDSPALTAAKSRASTILSRHRDNAPSVQADEVLDALLRERLIVLPEDFPKPSVGGLTMKQIEEKIEQAIRVDYPEMNPTVLAPAVVHAVSQLATAKTVPDVIRVSLEALEIARVNRAAENKPRDKHGKEVPPMNVPGYERLAEVLHRAYSQSARGKGKTRHANDKPFHEQPIMDIGRMSGIGGHVYQIMKKAQEAGGMAARGQAEAAQAEFLGAIVYAAAAHLLLQPRVDEPEDQL